MATVVLLLSWGTCPIALGHPLLFSAVSGQVEEDGATKGLPGATCILASALPSSWLVA